MNGGWRIPLAAACWIGVVVGSARGVDEVSQGVPAEVRRTLQRVCGDCHQRELSEGGLDLGQLASDLAEVEVFRRWQFIYDRVEKQEMPPTPEDFPAAERRELLERLQAALVVADRADIAAQGRGPVRRLNRDEYQQNLRDLLHLPLLDVRDLLPPDREREHCNKSAEVLDVSRVQLTAMLDAADAALREAMAEGSEPPPARTYRAVGARLFPENYTFGEREAMFFAKDNQAVEASELAAAGDDPQLELALFRSAHWPYYGYPRDFVADAAGTYRVRFSARAVLQQPGYRLLPAKDPVPMTFRARKPSGPDVSGDVRASADIIDLQPQAADYETEIRLLPGETFEYSLLGLPTPLARNVDGGPPTYRFPPFPEGGQPGAAFQWLEVTGPLPPEAWPPASHTVLFDDLGARPNDVPDRELQATRLLRRFVRLAARAPLPPEAVSGFEQLAARRLEQGDELTTALLAAYRAFLCSGHFLYLPEPRGRADNHAIASRLSHFLINSRPDERLRALADQGELGRPHILRSETQRLINSPQFERFVVSFTDSWLGLDRIRRDEPDIRLYPEYRFEDYLVESMRRETRAYFAAMIRENLPSRVVVDADFAMVNDCLAKHYGMPPVSGSALRRVPLPDDSPRGGLLTQAAIMKLTANGASTSPVIRGAWIMERLLGQPPPPPPPNVPAVEPDIRGATSIRELLALHTRSSSCAACHALFDPVGLALENFDIWGGWRTRYRGSKEGDGEPVAGIDRAGHDYAYTLAGSVDSAGRLSDGRVFGDVRELKQLLSDDERQLARNLLQRFIHYATGTPVRFSEREEVERLLDSCAADDYRVGDLLHALVQSPVFLGSEP